MNCEKHLFFAKCKCEYFVKDFLTNHPPAHALSGLRQR